MTTSTLTITAAELFADIQANEISVELEPLQIPPLATYQDSSAYPSGDAILRRDGKELLRLTYWATLHTPAWNPQLGYQVEFNDSQVSGLPHVTIQNDQIVIEGGYGTDGSYVIPIGETEDADNLARNLQEELGDLLEHAEANVLDATDEDILATLKRRRAYRTLVAGEHSVDVYAAIHIDRTVYAVDGSNELYDNTEDTLDVAKDLLLAQIDAEREALDDLALEEYSEAE